MSIDELIRRSESSGILSVRGVVARLMQIITAPDAGTRELKELIEVDPPLSARVLRVANSPYYGAPGTISEIDHALVWIGFDALTEIVLTQKVIELFSADEEIPGFTSRELWKHSLSVALMAKLIHRREFGEPGHDAYAAGLLHDIGILLERQVCPGEFARIAEAVREGEEEMTQAEANILGFDHGALGCGVTERWNFPAKLVEAIRHHHSPQEAGEADSRMARTLFISDRIAFRRGYGYGNGPLPERTLILACGRRIGLSEYGIDALSEVMADEMTRRGDGYLNA